MGGCIISLDWSRWLQMAHFNPGRADGNSLLEVEEYRTGISLGGGCHNNADGLALGEDRDNWSGSRPDAGRGGGGCRLDINGPQHDCVLWAERGALRHCKCGDTCR